MTDKKTEPIVDTLGRRWTITTFKSAKTQIDESFRLAMVIGSPTELATLARHLRGLADQLDAKPRE